MIEVLRPSSSSPSLKMHDTPLSTSPTTSPPPSLPSILTSPSSALPISEPTPALDSSPSSSLTTTNSEPSTPTTPTSIHHPHIAGHHSSVVPAYPYNVSMLPQNVGGAAPDDSGITTRLPSICVDYLSHVWDEEDIATSWKAMTRHKTEIANGVRLENASWRTWAKQRGNLKTISPETLNWLKDSDVTWLYGPLHTAVDAVPPPKVATASERLGLEPLRSLSDSKKVAGKHNKKALVITKPILKYRSLSDILLPPGAPSSPVLEHIGSGLDDIMHVPHARSDSNLVRLNGTRKSPLGSPREQSLERAHASDSSSSSRYNGDRRHISFNHRVEQCIAVDSTEEAKKYPEGTGSGSEDDGDDEDDVLTFGSSPRVPNFGATAQALTHAKHHSVREPHTIARLGPTTLKSTEVYPHPSPAVYYQTVDVVEVVPAAKKNGNTGTSSPMGGGVNGTPVVTYSARTSQPGRRTMYDYSNAANSGPVGWNTEEEDDYAMGFDYFSGGPDVGVGDEYDTASYGSTHLVGGSHEVYNSGSHSSYNPGGSYSPASSPYGPPPTNSNSNSSSGTTINSSSPTPPISVAIAGIRGPHSPAASSRDSVVPKRSILKNHRSRENSSASFDDSASASPTSPTYPQPRFGSLNASPAGSNTPSPSGSPYGSASTLANVMQSAGIPQVIQLRNNASGIRRSGSEEVILREGRGRSTSRGSSSSLERAASADRRTTTSVSPSSSYSPPGVVGAASVSGARPLGIPGSRRVGSSDSLNSLGGVSAAGNRAQLPDLVEASSESETETLRAVQNDNQEEGEEEVLLMARSPKSGIAAILERNSVETPALPIVEASPRIPVSAILVAPPLIPVASAVPLAHIAPRYRQPSPSAPTTSVDDETATRTRVVEPPASLSNSPALGPTDLASIPWSDESPAPSNAQRSLLRAARGESFSGASTSSGHHSGDDNSSLDRVIGSGASGRRSVDSSRGSTHDDYGFGNYDEDGGETGLVGRTFEVAGTARDLLGAITKGIWNIGRRSASSG